MRRAILILLGLVLTGLPASPAAAGAEPPSCEYVLTPEGYRCVIVTPPEPTPEPSPPPGPPPESPYEYVYIRGIGPCPNPGEVLWIIEVYLRATGELVSTSAPCLGPAEPTPPPPPPPPTEGEFVEAIEPLIELETSLSPPNDGFGGVSQLDTWFWCSNDAPINIDLSLGGWTTTATIEVQSLTWTVTGPDGTVPVDADECGSEPASDSDGESAAAIWTPNLPGDYAIVLEVVWGGSWTRSIGGASETFPLDDVTVTNAPIDYSVVEIQTVGRDN